MIDWAQVLKVVKADTLIVLLNPLQSLTTNEVSVLPPYKSYVLQTFGVSLGVGVTDAVFVWVWVFVGVAVFVGVFVTVGVLVDVVVWVGVTAGRVGVFVTVGVFVGVVVWVGVFVVVTVGLGLTNGVVDAISWIVSVAVDQLNVPGVIPKVDNELFWNVTEPFKFPPAYDRDKNSRLWLKLNPTQSLPTLKTSANSEVFIEPIEVGPVMEEFVHAKTVLAGVVSWGPIPSKEPPPWGAMIQDMLEIPLLVNDDKSILPLTDNTKSEPDSTSVNNNAI